MSEDPQRNALTELTLPTAWLLEVRLAAFQARQELDAVYTERDEHWAKARALLDDVVLHRLHDCLDPKNQLPF